MHAGFSVMLTIGSADDATAGALSAPSPARGNDLSHAI
jgi:hypothetical protein